MKDPQEQGWEELGARLRNLETGESNDAHFAQFEAMRSAAAAGAKGGAVGTPAVAAGASKLAWLVAGIGVTLLIALYYCFVYLDEDNAVELLNKESQIELTEGSPTALNSNSVAESRTSEIEQPARTSLDEAGAAAAGTTSTLSPNETAAPRTDLGSTSQQQFSGDRSRAGSEVKGRSAGLRSNLTDNTQGSVQFDPVQQSVTSDPTNFESVPPLNETTNQIKAEGTPKTVAQNTFNPNPVGQPLGVTQTQEVRRRVASSPLIPTTTASDLGVPAETPTLPEVQSVSINTKTAFQGSSNPTSLAVAGGFQYNIGRQDGLVLSTPTFYGYAEARRKLSDRLSLGLRGGITSYGNHSINREEVLVASSNLMLLSPVRETVTVVQTAEVDEMNALNLSLVSYYRVLPQLEVGIGARVSKIRSEVNYSSTAANGALVFDQTGAQVRDWDFGTLLTTEYRLYQNTWFAAEYDLGLLNLLPEPTTASSLELRTTAIRLGIKQRF
ncbi:hypothetical protein [Lewinella sp. 4G2]|uniref:hypothetical protein n=1 Tax=Lewinella sp. 4G2 TaxID=1803372 RepID=UPI0007B4EA9C|nr:hypothetical protein [Lewinella sp. 4G2]OAV45519.1 hypothetical protein A3850_013920 [Lewinella sp. 4G2]